MFRKTVTAVAGKDVIAELNQQIAEHKQALKDRPYSPVKRRILTACLDYVLQTYNNIGFMNATKTMLTMQENLGVIRRIGELKQRSDDDFIIAVRSTVFLLPENDKLRELVQRETDAAEAELAKRRETARHYTTLAAIGATLVLMYESPFLGFVALAAEISAICSVDCGRLVDKALEMYESSGYADVVVNGTTRRQLVTTYHEAIKDEDNRVELATPRPRM